MSNRAEMIVCGKRAKVIGRVCMDQSLLDVTGIDGVDENSVVTVIGRDGGEMVSVDEISELSGTINYEIVCLIGKRVPRIYHSGGKLIGQLNYIRMQENCCEKTVRVVAGAAGSFGSIRGLQGRKTGGNQR